MNQNFTWYAVILIIMVLYYYAKQTERFDMKPPVAQQNPYNTILHGQERVDNYHWVRLTDEQKLAKKQDEQTVQVVDYIKKENDYTQAQLKHTNNLQKKLYNEIVGRIKKDDVSVPFLYNGYWYYTRYEKGGEYPIYCRKKESLQNPEEVMINVTIGPKGKTIFH